MNTMRPTASKKNIPAIALPSLLLATTAVAQSPCGGTSETTSADSERPFGGKIQVSDNGCKWVTFWLD
jgi:hypothetical protein